MLEASAMMEYEQAGWFRNQLGRLRKTLNGRNELVSTVHDHNVVLIEPFPHQAGAQLFLIRYGRLAGRIDLPEEAEKLESAITELFDPSLPPPEKFGRPDVDEIRILAHWMRLRENATRQVHWSSPESPEAFLSRLLTSIEILNSGSQKAESFVHA